MLTTCVVRRLVSLSLSLLTLRLASRGAAQVGGHPHIAPLDSNLVDLPFRSPLCNRGNLQWDLGEAFWLVGRA